MLTKVLLPLGFIAVGIISVFPFLMGKDTSSSYKLIAGGICIAFGVGSLIYNLVKKN